MHSLIWQILQLTVFSHLILLTFLLSLRILCREGEQMHFMFLQQAKQFIRLQNLTAKVDYLWSSIFLVSCSLLLWEGKTASKVTSPRRCRHLVKALSLMSLLELQPSPPHDPEALGWSHTPELGRWLLPSVCKPNYPISRGMASL